MAENTDQNLTANNAGLADALGVCEYNTVSPLLNPASLMLNTSFFPISLMFMMITNAYKTHGWIKTAVSQPVDDAFRNGVDIESTTLEEDELELLRQTMEDFEDWNQIKDCLRWGRLYGGSVLIANTEQKVERPLNRKALKDKKLEFYATDRWQCGAVDPEMGVKQSNYLMEELEIDNSRVFVYTGDSAPFLIRQRLSGWGMSILEQILPEITKYLKAINVSLELLDEAKIDILQIEQLAEVLSAPEGTDLIRRRVDIANENKNYKNMLVIDAKDTYNQKQIAFSGYPEMVKQIMTMVAGALRMPVSKVFGLGSSGFSSGEDDMENYNAMIESEIRVEATRMIKWVIDLRCLQLFGRTLPDLKIKWKSLRVLNSKDEQEIKSRKFQDFLMLWDREIIDAQELMELCKRNDIVLMDTNALAGKKNNLEPNYKALEGSSFDKLKTDNPRSKL